MLTDEELEELILPFMKRQEKINLYVIKKIAKRVKEIGEILPSDLQQLEVIFEMGADVRKINKEIAKRSRQTEIQIKRLIKKTAKDIYLQAKPYYDYRKKPFIPFSENKQLQQTVNAVSKQTAGTFRNLSKAQAFMLRDPKNRTQFVETSLSKTYQEVIDKAVQASQQGVIDYNTAIRQTMEELTNSGLRSVTYEAESGKIHSQRLDTAVRRNVLSGIRMISEEVDEQIGKEIDADGKEISVHSYPAPDHAPIQGHQFTNENFERLQSSENFVDYTGEKFNAIARHISELNCRHYTFSIILGVMKPNYSKEQLQDILKRNQKGYTLPNGKHLTMYECTQKQRSYELKIRKEREHIEIAKTLGDDVLLKKHKAKLSLLIKSYTAFSKACGLKPYFEKTTI